MYSSCKMGGMVPLEKNQVGRVARVEMGTHLCTKEEQFSP